MNNEVENAMNILKQAMKSGNPSEPGSCAHVWHCCIAMMCYDAICSAGIVGFHDSDKVHKVSNDAASRSMRLLFDVETKA